MKLMDIDSDTLGIPDTEYDARVTMPSSEFTRIVRDLSQLGESVRIEVSKEGVRFASEGEAANGSVLLRQAEGATISGGKITAGVEEAKEDGDGEEAEGSTSQKKVKVKKEKKDSEDVEMDDEDGEKEADPEKENDPEKEDDADFNPDEGEEEKEAQETEAEDNEDEEGSGKKRKKKVTCFLLKFTFGC